MPIPENTHKLWRNEFKGNKHVFTEELELVVPFVQRENSKPLNLPITPRVGWYNFGLNVFNADKRKQKISDLKVSLAQIPAQKIKRHARVERKISKIQQEVDNGISWLFSNLGEKQVLISSNDISETSGRIQKYLFDKGYRDATVTGMFINTQRKNTVNVIYNIKENELYTIDSVFYQTNDYHLDSILILNRSTSVIRSGDAVNLQKVELEKLRIEQLFKNEGYFTFNNRYITYGITNDNESEEDFIANKKGHLLFKIENPSQGYHKRFELQEVIFKTFDPNNRKSLNSPDTTRVDEVTFIRMDNSVPLGVIRNRMFTKTRDIYNASAIANTQRQISLFNQFSFASSQLKILDSTHLSLEYFAPVQERFTFGISPGINNIYADGNSFFGFGIPVSLSMRNVFRRLETVELGIRGSYEGQPVPIQTSESAIRGSLELGGNLNITLPTLLPIRPTGKNINLKNPRTVFGIGYNYSEPFWGTRSNFTIKGGNSLQIDKNTILFFNFLDAYLINTSYANNTAGREFYYTLDSLQKTGNNLKVTFDPQFVSSINANFVFNNQDPSKPFSNASFFRVFAESGGTAINFLRDRDKLQVVERLFPLGGGVDSVRAYFQFLKINADFRKSINLSQKSSYAFRFNVGIANPYGKNKAIPYDKSFFIGGSNSVRAWAPRTLGTGSASPDTTSVGNTIPQPGDILLEGSIEYRKTLFRFAGNIQMALFLDGGNVWKWHEANIAGKYKKSNFEWKRFYKEFALGTGFGVRWDLNYFLFRFDWGIKVIDPSREEGDRFVLDKFSLRRNRPYGLNLNFGIGYPF